MEIFYRLVCLSIFISFSILRVHFISKKLKIEKDHLSNPEVLLIEGKFRYYMTNALIYLATIFTLLYIFYPESISFANISLSNPTRIFGAILGLAAFALLYFTHKSLGTNWSRSISCTKDHKLVTTGPYKYFKHPMYM